MIDPVLLRENPELVKRSQEARGHSSETVDAALDADRERRAAITAFEELRAAQNAHGKRVAQAPKDEKAALVAEAKELSAQVKQAQQRVTLAEEAAEAALSRIENIVIDGVPAGGEADFVTLRTHGEPRTFDFAPRDHLEIGEILGAIDMERGTKVSGSRFSFLTGFLGAHADEIYHLEEDDLFLVGTSEVPLAGYHMDEIIDFAKGPKRYAGWSTCYRREAGSYGKDTRGIIRVHQFNKLEMFVYTSLEDAETEPLRLVEMQERMRQDLGLAYRVIDVAAGDLGSSAARKYDVEAWVPTQDAYRELTSTSNCTTFQARRLDIRHRPDGGKTQHVATLNGTLATTRWIVALLETHQREDGSVTVPEVLRPYLGGMEILEPVA